MKRILLISILGFAVVILNAQIKVASNNNVGISENAPDSDLSVNDPGNIETAAYFKNDYTSNRGRAIQAYNYQSSGDWGYGLLSTIANTSSSSAQYLMAIKASAWSSAGVGYNRSYGVFGVAGGASNGYNYGLYGQILGTQNGAAIFASTPGKYDYGIGGIYAGYFRGKVYVEGVLEYTTQTQVSDINRKKNIRSLSGESGGQLDKIKTLNAIKYRLKTPLELNLIGPECTDTMSIENLSAQFNEKVYTEDQIGLSAQEVQKVFPELVSEDEDGFLQMNYIGLIPVLIEGMKEQQFIIEELQVELVNMRAKLDKLNEEAPVK